MQINIPLSRKLQCRHRLFYVYFAVMLVLLLIELLSIKTVNAQLATDQINLLLRLSWRAQLPLVHFVLSLLFIYALLSYCMFAAAQLFMHERSRRIQWMVAVAVLLLTVCALYILNAYYYPASHLSFHWLRQLSLFGYAAFIYLSEAWLIFLMLCSVVFLYQRYHYIVASVTVLVFFGAMLLANTQLISTVKGYFVKRSAKQQKPNIIMLVYCSWDKRMAAYYSKNVQSFIRHSVSFSNMMTPTARSMSTNVAILSGLYPASSGNFFNLTVRARTKIMKQLLPYDLNKLGYSTWALSSGTQFKPMDNQVTWGFQHRRQPNAYAYNFILTTILDAPWANLWTNFPMARFLFPYAYAMADDHLHFYPSVFQTRVRRVVHQMSVSRQPSFLYIVDAVTHHPFMTALVYKGEVIGRYKKMIRYGDEDLKVLITSLRKRKLLKNSIVFVLSDHGEDLNVSHYFLKNSNNSSNREELHLYKKGVDIALGHGGDVHALDQYHTMFAVHDFRYKPIFKQPQRIQSPALVIDIKPTISAMLAEYGFHDKVSDGISLLPLMQKSAALKVKPRYRYMHEGLYIQLNAANLTVAEHSILSAIKLLKIDHFGQHYLAKKHIDEFMPHTKFAVIYSQWQLAVLPKFKKLKEGSPQGGSKTLFTVLDIPKKQYILLDKRQMQTLMQRDANLKEKKSLQYVNIPQSVLRNMYHKLIAYRKKAIRTFNAKDDH